MRASQPVVLEIEETTNDVPVRKKKTCKNSTYNCFARLGLYREVAGWKNAGIVCLSLWAGYEFFDPFKKFLSEKIMNLFVSPDDELNQELSIILSAIAAATVALFTLKGIGKSLKEMGRSYERLENQSAEIVDLKKRVSKLEEIKDVLESRVQALEQKQPTAPSPEHHEISSLLMRLRMGLGVINMPPAALLGIVGENSPIERRDMSFSH